MSAKRFTGKTESDAVMNAAMELGIPREFLTYQFKCFITRKPSRFRCEFQECQANKCVILFRNGVRRVKKE